MLLFLKKKKQKDFYFWCFAGQLSRRHAQRFCPQSVPSMAGSVRVNVALP
jgi:hypothetical protein